MIISEEVKAFLRISSFVLVIVFQLLPIWLTVTSEFWARESWVSLPLSVMWYLERNKRDVFLIDCLLTHWRDRFWFPSPPNIVNPKFFSGYCFPLQTCGFAEFLLFTKGSPTFFWCQFFSTLVFLLICTCAFV